MSNKHFLAEAEEQLLEIWEKEQTFTKSLEARKGATRFSFYDGPPYANGLPHHGHAVQSILKDSVTRYKTMRGYYVPRRTGWDTHGLPIEYKIEQELGFRSKADILAYGIDKFNEACRQSVFTYVSEWNQFYRRLGRWADKDSAYATLDSNYIESVWWAFSQIYKKGLVYEDFRSTPYCPRCATPLSNFEVNQGYRDNVEDPSVIVKFKLKNDERKLLAWTTTPWSLPGNAAIAVHPGEVYVTAQIKNDEGQTERVIIAQNRLSALDQEYTVEAEMSGQELAGAEYEPLFKLDSNAYNTSSDNIYKVWGADFVNIEDGTGILHVAPAFGEDDLNLSKAKDIPVLSTIDQNGHLSTGLGLDSIENKFFKSADKPIIEHLAHEKTLFSAETTKHTYPFCWRCDSPLLYFATTSWFIKVSSLRSKLVNNNTQINWVPSHIKDGRFGKWLEGARDWAFSRNRFWGAPLPIWRTDDGEIIVVENITQLKELSVDKAQITDLHRPFIDNVVLKTPSGKLAYRVEEVFDVWFESGSMPYGQDHYPFENKRVMEDNFPADFIAEAMDQTRGWFYSLHVIATALFDKPAFKNCITTGWVNAADGEKLSKRKKNYTPLDTVFDLFGADSVRYFMMTSPIVHGEDIRFSSDALKEVQRNVFLTLQNTFNFFKMYQDIDGWKPNNAAKVPISTSVLDKWILSRLSQTITEVTSNADKYQIDKATKPIKELIDDLSNWYVRRSRRRFWKSEDDEDKRQAYTTLHYVLVTICQLLSPWAPFMSDRIYRELTAGTDMPESVHLCNWPIASRLEVDILKSMDNARNLVALGLAQRAEAKVKVRQPLRSATILLDREESLNPEISNIISEELNVKEILVGKSNSKESATEISVNTELNDSLINEGMARELIRVVQTLRKKIGLRVDDRIKLNLHTSSVILQRSVDEYNTTIMAETLATEITHKTSNDGAEKAKIDGHDVTISITKA